MITLQKLKDEVVGNMESEPIAPDHIEDVIEAFMDSVEAHGGTLRFQNPPTPGPARVVKVGMASEKSGAGRNR